MILVGFSHGLRPSEVVQIKADDIKDGYLTQSPDGGPVAPLMGDYKEYDGGLTAMRFYPLSYAYGMSDHGVIPRFTPLGPQLTEVEFIWLVHPDAVKPDER